MKILWMVALCLDIKEINFWLFMHFSFAIRKNFHTLPDILWITQSWVHNNSDDNYSPSRVMWWIHVWTLLWISNTLLFWSTANECVSQLMQVKSSIIQNYLKVSTLSAVTASLNGHSFQYHQCLYIQSSLK